MLVRIDRDIGNTTVGVSSMCFGLPVRHGYSRTRNDEEIYSDAV